MAFTGQFRVAVVVACALGCAGRELCAQASATTAAQAEPPLVARGSRAFGTPASPRLSLDDAVYAQLDRLIGSGLVYSATYGQRPYSRLEVARMVLEASEHKATHAVSSSTERLLHQLLARFTPEMRLLKASMRDSVPVREISRSASLELLMLDSPSRAIASAPTGGIAADINPLLNDRSGQRFAQSATAVATFDHAWQLGRHFSAQLQRGGPRIS